MNVRLIHPGGQEWRIDTPDSTLVGTWLKGIFDSFPAPVPSHYSIPVQLTIEIR